MLHVVIRENVCGNVLGMCWTRGDGDGDGDGMEVEREMDRDACDWLGGEKRDVEMRRRDGMGWGWLL